MFQENFNGVSRKVQGCFMFQGCSREFSKDFQASFKRVSRGIKVVSRVFQRLHIFKIVPFLTIYFKEVIRCSKEVLRVFLRTFKGVSRVF